MVGATTKISFSWWLAQRISGLLLGPLILVHVIGGEASSNKILGWALLLTIVVHAVVALIRLKTLTAGGSGRTWALSASLVSVGFLTTVAAVVVVTGG